MLADEVSSAKLAGLRYVIPAGRGIQRQRRAKNFAYIHPNGTPVKDAATLSRIKSLVIPPAWESVWISPAPNGHIQAVGRDARGRKQYRYHHEYRKVRDLVKFDRMREFGKLLPKIRRSVDRDLKRRGMPKNKILAAIVRLLETSYIRIGNEEYAEENGSFGLTTLRNQHVRILGEVLEFRFLGKSGQNHAIKLHDRKLARLVRQCRDLPGSSLFQYLDEEGNPQHIESGDVNDYLREITGGDYTAKDFRTWGGTCLAANFLAEKCGQAESGAAKTTLVDVVKNVAAKLGNRPATCRKYYIHPAVMDCYLSGNLQTLAEKYDRTKSDCYYEQLVLSLLMPLKRLRKKAA
jgi:DNA topoisomerase-1